MKRNKFSVTHLFSENLTTNGTVNIDSIIHHIVVRRKHQNIREDLTTTVVLWVHRTSDRAGLRKNASNQKNAKKLNQREINKKYR